MLLTAKLAWGFALTERKHAALTTEKKIHISHFIRFRRRRGIYLILRMM